MKTVHLQARRNMLKVMVVMDCWACLPMMTEARASAQSLCWQLLAGHGADLGLPCGPCQTWQLDLYAIHSVHQIEHGMLANSSGW